MVYRSCGVGGLGSTISKGGVMDKKLEQDVDKLVRKIYGELISEKEKKEKGSKKKTRKKGISKTDKEEVKKKAVAFLSKKKAKKKPKGNVVQTGSF